MHGVMGTQLKLQEMDKFFQIDRKSHPYRTLCTSATLTIILGLATTLNIWPHAQTRCYLLA